MRTWDIQTLEIEPHHPQVLSSAGEMRAIAISLPGGEQLQEHQVHERAYLFVADGEITDSRLVLVLAPWPGVGHPSQPR
jgi:hypothetical protein